MSETRRGVVTAVVSFLLVCSLAGPVVGLPTGGPDAATTQQSATLTQSTDDTIDLTQSYALTPERPGEVEVTLAYEIPDRVTELESTLPPNATVTDADGFDSVNETVYEWDGRSQTATITLRFDPNETAERTGREAASGNYLFADAGEWALFRRVRTGAAWRYTGGSDPVTLERSATTDGPGVTGNNIVYLGAVSTVERTANGQTFRLVVPEAASLAESPDDILDSLSNASGSLQVGHRDETVVAIAAPTDGVEWAVRGLELGGSDFFVRDSERLDTPSNVWLHEYVHTRQSFSTTSETRWLTEGTAVYYGAQLSLEQDRITFEEFSEFLDDGERAAYDDVVLAQPPTWVDTAHYVKGPLAVGGIDEAMRAETNRTGTFEQTFRRLNDADGRVTQTQFLDAVESAGGPDSRATAAEYTETAAALSMWDRRTHSNLFGQLPANVGYALPANASGYRVGGPYRNATAEATPLSLATGETLTVDSVVRNTGGTDGPYNATLTVDGRVVATQNGTVEAESERTVPLSHTFDSAGTYTVGVGEERLTVSVEPAAEPTVTDLSVAPDSVRRGGETTLSATVGNDAAVPANGTVVFTRNGEAIAQRVVTLAPGASTELSVPVALSEAGEIRLGAGSQSVTVTVVEPTASPSVPSSADGPGFTATLAVFVLVLTLWTRRRSDEPTESD